MKRSDRRHGKGLLERVEADVGEVGGVPIGGLLADIVDQHLHKTQRQNPFKCLPHTSRLGAVDPYGENLGFFFPRDLVREFRESPKIAG